MGVKLLIVLKIIVIWVDVILRELKIQNIIGINADKTIRLITEENVTAISYNVADNSNFEGSYADSWLNDYFYSRLKNNNIIRNESFCQGAATTNTPTRTDCTGGTTISRNVGLISADEYYLLSGTIIATSIQTDSSYMHTSESFVSMSPYIPPLFGEHHLQLSR